MYVIIIVLQRLLIARRNYKVLIFSFGMFGPSVHSIHPFIHWFACLLSDTLFETLINVYCSKWKGRVMHSLCETSSLLRTVHYLWVQSISVSGSCCEVQFYCCSFTTCNTLLIRMDHYFWSELYQNLWRTHVLRRFLCVLHKFLRRKCVLHRFSVSGTVFCVCHRNLWRTCVLRR